MCDSTMHNTIEMLRFSGFYKAKCTGIAKGYEDFTKQTTKDMRVILDFYKAKGKGNANIFLAKCKENTMDFWSKIQNQMQRKCYACLAIYTAKCKGTAKDFRGKYKAKCQGNTKQNATAMLRIF